MLNMPASKLTEMILSQSRFVVMINGGAVSWKSSKQDVVAQSTTKSEYIATSEAAKEAVWFKKFIEDLGVVPSIQDPIPIFVLMRVLLPCQRNLVHTRELDTSIDVSTTSGMRLKAEACV